MPTAAAESPHLLASVRTALVRSLLSITVVGAAFALGTPAAMTASPLYDTTRVLAHTNNECLALPENKCRTIQSQEVPLDAGAATRIEVNCVPNFPYVVGWDAEQHEHIGLTLVSAPPDRSEGATASAARRDRTAVKLESVTVYATNLADAPGSVTLFIGCAVHPATGMPFPLNRYGVPTNALRQIDLDNPQ